MGKKSGLCLKTERKYRKRMRDMETDEERERRLQHLREYTKRHRQLEDSWTRERRLSVKRELMASLRKSRKRRKLEAKSCLPLFVPVKEENQCMENLPENLDLVEQENAGFDERFSSQSSKQEVEEENHDGEDFIMQDSDEEDGLLQRPEFIPVRDNDDLEEENQLWNGDGEEKLLGRPEFIAVKDVGVFERRNCSRKADADARTNSILAAMQIEFLKSASVKHLRSTHDLERRAENKSDTLEADIRTIQIGEEKRKLCSTHKI